MRKPKPPEAPRPPRLTRAQKVVQRLGGFTALEAARFYRLAQHLPKGAPH